MVDSSRSTASNASIEIRPARAADREQVLALMPRLEAFGPPANVPTGEIADGEAREMARAFDQMPDGGALFVAVNSSGTVLGVAFLETRIDYFTQEPHGHLGVLAVAGEAEGRGVGRSLLDMADRWARDAGFDRITLSVFHDNVRARAVYERAGYAPDIMRYRKDLAPGG